MQKKLATSLLGMGFLVLVASLAFQGFEQKAFAVVTSNPIVSCGLHCAMQNVLTPALHQVGKVASAPTSTMKLAPVIQPVGKIGSGGKGPLNVSPCIDAFKDADGYWFYWAEIDGICIYTH